ncbi:MAG: secondary thiamine-phosphate synthase enzyme YjbQ [Methylomonas sp.]
MRFSPDDMPAHIKNVILGTSLTIPVSKGQMALGMWQGIYLCEHRDHAGKRTIIVTLHGK